MDPQYRKVRQVHGGLSPFVVIPPDIAKEIDIKIGDYCRIEIDDQKRIVITKAL